MPTRPHDLAFAPEEKLWRRVEVSQVRGDEVRPNSLRLQISTVRERHGTRESVPSGKWNGVAETVAGGVVALDCGAISLVCVDDPCEEIPGHALVAMVVILAIEPREPKDRRKAGCLNKLGPPPLAGWGDRAEAARHQLSNLRVQLRL
jgi:hypothetical protein